MKLRESKAGRRVVTAALTTVLMTAGLAFAVQPAQAADPAPSCAYPTNKPNGEGHAKVKADGWLYDGPYSACGIWSSVDKNQGVWLYCFWENEYGNWWWYVRREGSSTAYGWIWDGFITKDDMDDNNDGVKDGRACY
jgi:hypothetical protein